MISLHNTSPIITIDLLTEPDVLYPYYGYFKGLPSGLSHAGFHELIKKASTFMQFYMAYYNGELVCIFECRAIPGDPIQYETHSTWLTDSKRKRAITLDRFLDNNDKRLVTFVRPDEADGHFAFARRGKMDYLGEINDMHVFRSW